MHTFKCKFNINMINKMYYNFSMISFLHFILLLAIIIIYNNNNFIFIIILFYFYLHVLLMTLKTIRIENLEHHEGA